MTTLIIENLFQEKLLCYRELVEILKEERQWILKADVEALWRMNTRKRETVAAIEKIRAGMIDALNQAGIPHGMTLRNFQAAHVLALLPSQQRNKIIGALPSLTTLKEEIRTIGADNRRYIESCLGMVDDLMSILTGADRTTSCYPGHRQTLSEAPRLLHREV